jgi:hypothetical protein
MELKYSAEIKGVPIQYLLYQGYNSVVLLKYAHEFKLVGELWVYQTCFQILYKLPTRVSDISYILVDCNYETLYEFEVGKRPYFSRATEQDTQSVIDWVNSNLYQLVKLSRERNSNVWIQ